MAMEEPSYCNLSLAVDCTLSLGSSTSRGEIPARLSRAGSPDQDLAWSLGVRSDQRVDPSRAHTCEADRIEQAMSWGGSCDRSDPGVSLEYFPQVSETEGRGSDGGRSGLKAAWPRSTSSHRAAHSFKDGVNTSKAALISMIKNTQSYRNRVSRQPWLSDYIPSTAVVEVKPAASQCTEEGDSDVRVCAHCGTSKTPLWRNGPGGPKSLCNACGIRFKKAGRRSAANGTASESQVSPPTTPKAAKRKLADDEDQQQYWVYPPDAKPRKRSRGSLLRASDSLLSGSCMTWQSLPLQRVDSPPSPPPRTHINKRARVSPPSSSYSSDEEEGAVLLMALSCGMVNA
ncbi:hypothetical protein M758_11G090400 [Ceratodon purpureus]|nr:hypothetical protein M758_11G090400 [Ceratodon purpureus]